MTPNIMKFKGASISVANSTKGSINITKHDFYLEFNYPCGSTTDCTPYELNLPRGQYLFEIYGASGGDVENKGLAGFGGFSRGFYPVRQISKRVFLYLGGVGSSCSSSYMCSSYGGFNGGGKAFGDCAGGGGASDLRIDNEITITDHSTDSRILVAGGGGGGRSQNTITYTAAGGNGGGLQGGQGIGLDENVPCIATQDSCDQGSGIVSNGLIWKGADGNSSWGDGMGGSGGGGGYIGGGTCADCSGSGGSGFFSTEFIIKGETSEATNIGNGKAFVYFFVSLTLNQHHSCFPNYVFFVIIFGK